MNKKIYISGPITGMEEKAFTLFEAAELLLLDKGYKPVNPMKLNHSHHDRSWNSFMREDIKALCDCDAIYLLASWPTSKGALLELKIAESLGLRIVKEGELSNSYHSNTLPELFNDIIAWQKETFGTATAESKLHHLKQEVDELFDAIVTDNIHRRLEFADYFFLLFGAAASDGMSFSDIVSCIAEKFAINKNRKWGQPDEKGVVNHLK